MDVCLWHKADESGLAIKRPLVTAETAVQHHATSVDQISSADRACNAAE